MYEVRSSMSCEDICIKADNREKKILCENMRNQSLVYGYVQRLYGMRRNMPRKVHKYRILTE